MHKTICALASPLACCLWLTPASAAMVTFSFTGSFSADDDVQLVNFTVDTPADTGATVILRSFSYGGGTQGNGHAVTPGGFDPVLSLFDAAGVLIGSNDDDLTGTVNPDPSNSVRFDTLFQAMLDDGDYTVALSQYDNFAAGSTLADGFLQTGSPFFTVGLGPGCTNGRFCDAFGGNRTSAWAFDIVNVDNATLVPIPAAFPLLLSGLAGLGFLGRWRRPASA